MATEITPEANYVEMYQQVANERHALKVSLREVCNTVDDLLDLVIWASGAFDTEEKSGYWKNADGPARIDSAFKVLAKARGESS